MASRYRAYRPDHGETIDDAKYSEADSVREAAKLYAERIWPSCDYPSSIDVVIVEPDGAEWEVAVDVESIPDFYANKPKARKLLARDGGA